MKKIIALIIAAILVISLAGCNEVTPNEDEIPTGESSGDSTVTDGDKDVNDQSGNEENPLPKGEVITLGELIKKEDVVYIRHRETFFGDARYRFVTTYDTDEIFALVIDENVNIEFVGDTEEKDDLFFRNWCAACDSICEPGVDFIELEFYGNYNTIMYLITLYPNGLIIFTDFVNSVYYVSADYTDVKVDELSVMLYD